MSTLQPPSVIRKYSIYPSYCHSLSPTLNKWCPLQARDIYALTEVPGFQGQGIYFHLNHPVKWVRLTGVVTAIDDFVTRLVYTLDDSSGVTIEATCTAPPPEPAPRISADGPDLSRVELGSVVKVKGGIGAFRGGRQIRLKAVVLLGDTNAEIKCWGDMKQFKSGIWAAPWALRDEQIDLCRIEAEREEGEKRKRRKDGKDKGRGRSGRSRIEQEKFTKIGEEKNKKKGLTSDLVGKVHQRPSKAVMRAAAGKYSALGL